jgi:hypothetical protein
VAGALTGLARALRRELPSPLANLLDTGLGRMVVVLAAGGYRLTLLDPSEAM